MPTLDNEFEPAPRECAHPQAHDRQIEALDAAGVEKRFEDRTSGKDAERPALAAMLDYIREGDTLVVGSMDRLARSLGDLLDLAKRLTEEKRVEVRFVKENLAFKPGGRDPYSNFQMQVLGAVAELERELIRSRQAEGIALAKKKGRYKGRKPALTAEQIEFARHQITAGVPKSRVARDLGVSRQTLYTALLGEGTYADPEPVPSQ